MYLEYDVDTELFDLSLVDGYVYPLTMEQLKQLRAMITALLDDA